MRLAVRNVALSAASVVGLVSAVGAQNEIWPVWRDQGALTGARELAATADGGVIIASNSGASGEVRALDALGRLRWSTALPIPALPGARVEGVAVLTNGEVVALVSDGANVSAGGGNYFVSRISANGALLATTPYGGPDEDAAFDIAAHPSGGYVVVGSSQDGYGAPITPGSAQAGFVAHHDASGTELWVRRVESLTATVGFNAAVVSAQGEIRAYGWSYNPLDPYRRESWASLTAGGSIQTTSLNGALGEYRWARLASDGSTFTGSQGFSGAVASADSLLRRTTSQGVETSWFLSTGFGADSVHHAAVDDGQGGIYAWVTDAAPTWAGQPAFTGVVRYSSSGQVLWSQAEASAVDAAVPLPFNEIATSTAGTGAVQRYSRGAVGTPGCSGQPNSTGSPAVLRAAGSAQVSDNALVLFANNLPPNVNTLCVVSRNAVSVPSFAGGLGTLCLGAPLARVAGVQASPLGLGAYSFNLLATPSPTGPQPAQPGDLWRFQVWYRDVVAGSATTNLSSSVSVLIP